MKSRAPRNTTSGKSAPAVARTSAPTTFKDRDLTKVNPLSEQFEPTPGAPIRQHKRMAGGG